MALCECGCGQEAPIAVKTDKRFGWKKGEPKRFVHGHQSYSPEPYWIEKERDYETPCWIWQRAFNTHGRAQITVKGRSLLAPRYYYEKEYGAIPEGMHLHHLCEQADCMNPHHLQPLTPKAHAHIRKNNKISMMIAEEMRKLYAKGGYSYTKLGKMYGVAPMTAWHAVNKRTWS